MLINPLFVYDWNFITVNRECTDKIVKQVDYGSRTFGHGTVKNKTIRGLILDRCLKAIELNNSMDVLEVGCGAGSFTMAIQDSKPGLRVYGCDISIEAIKNINKNVFVVQSDALHLPYKNSSFDTVFMLDVLEHLNSPEIALSEANKVLKRNGILHCHVPCEGNFLTLHSLLKYIRELKKNHLGHIYGFTTGSLSKMITSAGFEIKETSYSLQLFGQIYDIALIMAIEFFPSTAFQIGSIKDSCFIKDKGGRGKGVWFLKGVNYLANFLTYYESILFSKVPLAIGVHITAIKK